MRHGPPVNVVENIQDVIVRERVQQARARSPMSGHDDAPHLRQREKESTKTTCRQAGGQGQRQEARRV
jgi:hypothetical protein